MTGNDGSKYPVYTRKQPRTWWLSGPGYRRFAAREFTSVFAAAYSVILLLFLLALSRGPDAYEGFLRWLELPGIVVLHALLLVALLYHAVTWLQLTAKATVIRLGRLVVPREVLVTLLFGGWLVVSALAAYLYGWF